jgi:GGDEF domain-containing protein
MGVVLDDKHKLLDRSQKSQKRGVEITKKVNQLSKQTLNALSKENIIPTPANYKSYFEKQLEKRPTEDKKSISAILDDEEHIGESYIATLEKDIHDAYLNIKKMTESIAHSYTKIGSLNKIIKTVDSNITPASLVNVQDALDSSLKHLQNDLKSIKEGYTKTAQLINNFNKNSIYDKRYGVHNKKYLLRTVEDVIKNSALFEYPNTLMAIRIKPQILAEVKLKRDQELIKLTLSKLLYKRSRRSDIIAHYEDGIFMILLKHTNVDFANIAKKRIEDSVENANFMVDGREIDLKLDFGIASIEADDIKESVITEAIDNLS